MTINAQLKTLVTCVSITCLCLWPFSTAVGAEEGDDEAKPSTNKKENYPPAISFKKIINAEEAAKQLNMTQLTVYSEANAPKAAKLEELEKKTAITQYGFTWTFDKAVPVGQFINGDWYVVGPVTVVMINPKPLFGNEITEGFIDKMEVAESKYPGKQARNGSTLNPKILQNDKGFVSYCGFDSRIPSGRYKADMFTPLPIAMKPGDCLLSSISRPNSEITRFGSQQVDSIRAVAALSCVAEPQPADAFRPSYCDSANSKPYRARNLQRNLLLKLPRLKSMPESLAKHARLFERPWEDLADFGFSAPLDNMPHYAQESTEIIGEATLLLQMDYSPEAKERLLVNFVQMGIDFWGLTRAGRLWQAHGGLNQGRKWPIIFAGLMLADADMQSPKKAYPKARFHEDDQTAMCPYTYKDKVYERGASGARAIFVGHSMWTDGATRGDWDAGKGPIDLFHPKDWPRQGSPGIASEGYRISNTSSAWVGQALAARLMHAEKIWNHEAYFAYVDRWMTEDDTALAQAKKDTGRTDVTATKIGEWGRQGNVTGNPFIREMWKLYRNNIPPGPNGEKTPPAEETWK
ncbi:MAG: hypothetical protein AAB263_09755 [Planctomycetota bacterium]